VCLGSGAALADGRDWSSLLLDGRILLDLPPTAVPRLNQQQVDISKIKIVFISHLHADHAFGLPFLLLEYYVRRPRETPLFIVGPSKLEEITLQLYDLAWPDLRKVGFEPRVPLRFVPVAEEGEYVAGDIRFTAVPMQHFGLDAFGYRLEYKGRSIGYTGDTGDCAELHRLLKGVDLAILELTYPYLREAVASGHMDLRMFQKAASWLKEQGSAIMATHLSVASAPIPGVDLCEDGKTYWI
jgi:ribonuclease BN (tRNA processing enzyme)